MHDRPDVDRLCRIVVYIESMSDAVKNLLDDGLNLPEDERLDLASALWASVAREPDPEWEAAWKAEIERRIADPRPNVPWDDVRRSLRSKLKKP